MKTFDRFAERFNTALEDTQGYDRFDFLINNAGISHHNSIEESTEALYNVHFKDVSCSGRSCFRSSMMAASGSGIRYK
jgi:hypothetical protein